MRETIALAARVAGELAAVIGLCHPDAAAAVTRLAGLGWEAVAAISPRAVRECLADPVYATDPVAVQQRYWGTTAAVVARRLSARWRLPAWVTGTIGFLRLPSEDAARVGAPDGLFRVVRAAVAAAELRTGKHALTDPRSGFERDAVYARAGEIADRLSVVADVVAAPTAPQTLPPAPRWALIRLLRASAQARRATGSVWLAEAEGRIDHLTAALADLRSEFDTELRDAKLASVAEFAAGASHEINNPLAVISGHAQMLLHRETDSDRRHQLAAIVRQTKRVHELLQGTLQFARPPRPRTATVSLPEWLADAVAAHRPDAEAKGVSLELVGTPGPVDFLRFDPSQLRTALAQLVRNALEAVSQGGWVRVTASSRRDGAFVSVEDSGPGPAADHLEHLFDPFFSGRSAGRGRGLGLPIAWRLAQINGGDVRYEPLPGTPARFILVLPRVVEDEPLPFPDRLSA
ncbi:ATP-binding protein [Fimbriiglobus ruber]|uniref:histidine kinase n=1 Tax=Fimbriiglobus ruber TaxID=1908690 RepID=A0A225EGQ7_9BACT|nr:ATP-binding protein [Fimbriiglobus ruber]OWK47495.1 sensor histidine kinase [Fimbriiglobus ruber]